MNFREIFFLNSMLYVTLVFYYTICSAFTNNYYLSSGNYCVFVYNYCTV